ncbi:MAG: DNA cytosine methyltransferase [Candidatus Hydrogenedentes bacterium]|nr:DNA cytosine methyltransferase [Candidatus Hydrogenedentota bacterium]
MKENQVSTRPLAIELFAGAGGMSLGFEQAGFDLVAAVELDPVHCAVHEFNFPNCTALCRDIRQVSGVELKALAKQRGGSVDLVFGGPPCQGFSLIGKRAIDDPRNGLVLEFVRLVCETSAKYFVFENVKGLTIGKHRQFLAELVAEFERSGYRVRLPWRVLNAADYGVPQDRQRVFLLGARADLPLPDYPIAISCPPRSDTLPFDVQSGPTVWDAIGDLPDAEDYEELIGSDSARVRFGAASEYAKILRGKKRDPGDFAYPRVFNPALITSSLRTDHSQDSRARFAQAKNGTTEAVSRFFKLDPNGICNTLRAGTASDRGAFTSPRPIHPTKPRCITVREAARLHSYPDWFRFNATKWHGARQVGNSVPPYLARSVAASVIRALGITPTKPAVILALGDESLLKMTMRQACAYYDVASDVIPQRIRESRTGVSTGNSR